MVPPQFARAAAFGVYEGRLKEAIHALKYGRIEGAARGLGRMLAEAIAHLAGEAPEEMLVVPVPLHRSKSSQRGFNQARLLAAEAIGFVKKRHPGWRLTLAPRTLMRLRATASQAGLNPRQRRLNVRGAFSVFDAGAVAGRNILLVDDILTTGATAREAARVLMEAGAATVWVATLARAQRASQAHGDAVEEEWDSERQADGPPPMMPPERMTWAEELPSRERASS
jgi:ComF family protein